MRYRFMATYLGVPYHAGLGPDGTELTLFSPAPPPEDLGFIRMTGHWRKKVGVNDITALWQSRLVGEYRGERCLVLDDLGDRLHIAYLGRDTARARQLGYWEIDREVFEVVVARQEVIGLTEERVDFPLTSAIFPPSGNLPPSGGFGPSGAFLPSGSRTSPGRREGPALTDRTGPQAAFTDRTGPQAAFTDRTGPQAAFERTAPLAAYGRGQTAGEQSRYDRAERPSPAPDRAERPAATTDRAAAWHGSPAAEPWPARQPQPGPGPGAGAAQGPGAGPGPGHGLGHGLGPGPAGGLAGAAGVAGPAAAKEAGPPPGRRTGRRDRVSPQSVFAELLMLSGIPQGAYAVENEVPGAMCVIKADGGFEVFSRTDDARLDVRFFEDEEAAYFYLFGVLAAEAVRSGRLGPLGALAPGRSNGYQNGSVRPGGTPSAPPSASAENVSKYLRCRKLPKSVLSPARVYLAGGADGPPLPKQPRRPLHHEAQYDWRVTANLF
jgi:hypothetical protein